MMIRTQMYINGAWVDALSKARRDIINPFNQEVIATVTEGDAADTEKAIEAARQAFEEGTWPNMLAQERGAIVHKIGELIRDSREELAELETLNTGKTLTESLQDMDDIADVFTYFASLADKNGGEVIHSPIPDSISQLVREPVGVCAQITPWNYPLLQAAWKLAPALVTGNTLVIKPSEITPLTTIKVFEIFEEVGLPAGVANLVLGVGDTVGAQLSESEDVDLISFTGGINTGKHIMQKAAQTNLKKVILELGGKNPNIVFEDADFDLAVDQALNAVFFHAGQVCSAGARLLVQDTIYDKFLDELIEKTKKIKLGNGFDEATQCGPLISAEHLEKVEKYVQIAQDEGATVALGGKRPEDPALQDGFFYLPTIITDCQHEDRIVQEEVFGPVLTVEKFSTTEEVIEKANDTIYGLAGAVFSKDIEKAEYVVSKLRLGTVWINDFHPYFPQAPWGGFKQSGVGYELGEQGLNEYTEIKHVYRNTNPQPLHWFK